MKIYAQIVTKLKSDEQAKYLQPELICAQSKYQNQDPSHGQYFQQIND